MDKNEVWHVGEEVAAAHLSSLGWEILERNWRCPSGELDIIARQPGPPEVVVFCEVKTRRGRGYGLPVEAITASKLAKLRQLGQLWLRERQCWAPQVRLDAVGVLLSAGREPMIDHLRGIG